MFQDILISLLAIGAAYWLLKGIWRALRPKTGDECATGNCKCHTKKSKDPKLPSICIAALLSMAPIHAQTLSDSASISIWTMTPAHKYLYIAFGHSGIRIQDPKQNIDIIFNYGIFDFDKPYFYLNYLRGYLWYEAGASSTKHFFQAMQEHGCAIYEQKLRLSSQEKIQIYRFLIWNIQPENKSYRYHYYYDNCATRIRDLITAQAPDIDLSYNYLQEKPPSFRALTNERTSAYPWERLAINLLFGTPIDQTVSNYTAMFLPEYVHKAFSFAKRTNQKPLTHTTKTLWSANPKPITRPLHPKYVLWACVIILLILFKNEAKKPKTYTFIDMGVCASFAIMGTIMLLFWVATEHESAQYNYDLLWMHPLHGIAAFWGYKGHIKHLRLYFYIQSALIGLYFIGWLIARPALPHEYIPLMILIPLRSLLYAYRQIKGRP